MSATRTAQAFPGTQQLTAAFGVVVLAIAILLVVTFGVLAAPKATVTSPSAGAAPALSDHGSISDPANVSGLSAPAISDHGSISDPANVVVSSSKSFVRGNHLSMPR